MRRMNYIHGRVEGGKKEDLLVSYYRGPEKDDVGWIVMVFWGMERKGMWVKL